MRKLDKLTAQFPDEYRRTWTEKTGGSITAAKYEVNGVMCDSENRPAPHKTEAAKANAVKMRSAPKTAL